MRTLNQWLLYIESLHPKTIDMGLDRLVQVASRAQLQQFSIPVITVAGTNGKGSTVATLGKLLCAANLRVGTYTSPHLLCVNERIQINGQNVSSNQLQTAFAFIEDLRGTITLSYFEFFTLAALFIFQRAQLDMLILEVGLGGRLDAVNIVDPTLAVITAIGYDHQDYLGSTLDAIASQKAGILRQGIPAVLSDQAIQSSILNQLTMRNNRAYFENQDFAYQDNKSWRFGDFEVALPQHNLPENSVSLALAAYTILGSQDFKLPPLNTVVNALENLGMMGRFQTVWWQGKCIIFDVAHNPLGSTWLHKKLGARHNLIAVWASLKDKDLEQIASPLLEKVAMWHIGSVDHERAASCDDLKRALNSAPMQMHDCITTAFKAAFLQATTQDTILVFGSFYTVAQVMTSHSILDEEIRHGLILSRC